MSKNIKDTIKDITNKLFPGLKKISKVINKEDADGNLEWLSVDLSKSEDPAKTTSTFKSYFTDELKEAGFSITPKIEKDGDKIIISFKLPVEKEESAKESFSGSINELHDIISDHNVKAIDDHVKTFIDNSLAAFEALTSKIPQVINKESVKVTILGKEYSFKVKCDDDRCTSEDIDNTITDFLGKYEKVLADNELMLLETISYYADMDEEEDESLEPSDIKLLPKFILSIDKTKARKSKIVLSAECSLVEAGIELIFEANKFSVGTIRKA